MSKLKHFLVSCKKHFKFDACSVKTAGTGACLPLCCIISSFNSTWDKHLGTPCEGWFLLFWQLMFSYSYLTLDFSSRSPLFYLLCYDAPNVPTVNKSGLQRAVRAKSSLTHFCCIIHVQGIIFLFQNLYILLNSKYPFHEASSYHHECWTLNC